MLTDYQIRLLSRDDGSVKNLFGQGEVNNASYSRVWNALGTFAIEFQGSDALWAQFELDDMIEFERRHPVTGQFAVEDTFYIRFFNRFIQDSDDRIIIGGYSLDHLLKRRLIDPADDPIAAGGYSIKAGPADAVMHDLADEQMGSLASIERQVPGFTVGSVANIGNLTGDKFRYENLLDTFQDLGYRGDIDFKISRTTGRSTVLTLGKFGQDYTFEPNLGFTQMVLLEPQKGNLIDPNLTLDYKDEITWLYAQGQGPGNSRIVAQLGSDRFDASPFNRIEGTEDFRNLDRSTGSDLLSAGYGALQDLRGEEDFDFDIDATLPGTVYRQDWDLYDRITVKWQTQRNYRITEIEVRFDAGGETIRVGVEDA